MSRPVLRICVDAAIDTTILGIGIFITQFPVRPAEDSEKKQLGIFEFFSILSGKFKEIKLINSVLDAHLFFSRTQSKNDRLECELESDLALERDHTTIMFIIRRDHELY